MGVRLILTAILLAWLAGCAVKKEDSRTGNAKPVLGSITKTVTGPAKGVRETWRQWFTPRSQSRPPSEWDWAVGIPSGVPRADIVSPIVPPVAVAYFLPRIQASDVALVSTAPPEAPLTITSIGGRQVKNYHQLHNALQNSLATGKPARLTLGKLNNSPLGGSIDALVSHSTLLALSQSVAPEVHTVRVTEDGNPWILIRQDGIRCKLMARVERETGLLNVVVSLASCWGPQSILPVEVRAHCDGESLPCLSAPQALDWLYGNLKNDKSLQKVLETSFAEVSEADDYLIPSNFKRVYQQTEEVVSRELEPPLLPALATLQGIRYPGSAVLGDARALTAFLARRQIYHPGDKERIGWVLFGGESLRDGGTIDIDLDLGSGNQRYTFNVPAP